MNIFHSGSVKFNFVMNVLLKVSGALCAAVTYPFAFRMLGAEQVGKIAFVTSVVSFFMMLGTLGIPAYGIRECAGVRDDAKQLGRTAKELLVIQMTMTTVAVLAFGVVVSMVPRLHNDWKLCLIQGSVLMAGGFGTEWLFAGLEQYGYITLRSTAAKILAVLLTFCLIRDPSDYLLYAALLAMAAIVPHLLNLVALRHVLWRGWIKEKDYSCWRHIRPILLFFAQTVAITVYTSLDTTMLGFMKGDYWTGIYDAAVKIKLILTLFVTSLGTVLLPRLSYYIHEEQQQKFQKQLSKSMEFTLITGIPLVLFFMIMAPEVVELLCGVEFLPAALVLRILLPAVFLIGCSNITGTQMLTPTGRERSVVRSVVVGAGVDLLLNGLLIPTYATAGAAIGTLAAEAAVLAVQVWYLWEELPELLRKLSIKTTICAVMISTVPLVGIKMMTFIPLIVRLAIGAIVFFSIAAGVLFWGKEPLLQSVVFELKKRS